MKRSPIALFIFLSITLLSLANCSKDELAENQKNIKKLWKLDKYLINGVDKTSTLLITNYKESYTDNGKYDRSYTDKNGTNQSQNGSFEFSSASRLQISGVGSIEFSNAGTASSSYYDISKLTDTELWYSYTNGNMKHEFHLLRN